MNHKPSTILSLFTLCIISAIALSGGCKSHSAAADPSIYPWTGPITDGTNGIVQPPRW